MPLSDSDDLSTPANLPADSVIEECLKRTVRAAAKKDEEITVKLARSRVEKELGLDEGFFRDNDQWKQKSKDIINDTFQEPESPEQPKKPVTKSKLSSKAGTKRKSDDAPSRNKRVKKSPVPDSEDVDMSGEIKAKKDVGTEYNDGNTDVKSKVQPKSEEESALSEPPEDVEEAEVPKINGKQADDDESDFSDVIDEPAPKKKRQKKSSSPSASAAKIKAPNASKAAKSKPAGKELSADEEEIKKLQSWLMKCGIRKLWHRELADYSTSKEKIKHLKGMLEDVGMTGRFSAEKAKQIKEARELKAELESAKEFNEQWGHESDEEDGGDDRKAKEEPVTKRLKPKGLVDFGDSDDDTD